MVTMVTKTAGKAAGGAIAKFLASETFKTIGWASLGAGVVNFALDKGTDFAKSKIVEATAKKKAELEKKKVAIQAELEAEKANDEETHEENPEAVVEEKPKKAKKKNK